MFQVLVDPHFLYAMTSVGVETYTARGVVAAMTHAQDVDLVHNVSNLNPHAAGG